MGIQDSSGRDYSEGMCFVPEVTLWDVQGRLIGIGSAAFGDSDSQGDYCSFYGLHPDECSFFSDTFGRELTSLLNRCRTAGITQQQVFQGPLSGMDPVESSDHTADVVAEPILDQSGGMMHILMSLRIPSASIRMDHQLDRREKQLRAVLDAVPSMIFVVTDENRYLTVNQAFADWEGVASTDEVVGRQTGYYRDEEGIVPRWVAENHRVIMEQGEPLEVIEKLENGRGEPRWTRTTKVPCPDGVFNRPAVIGISTDITHLKETELELERLNRELELRVASRTDDLRRSLEELEAARDQLVRSERLAAVGSMVGGIAHEINTPLGIAITAISHIENLFESVKSSEEMEEAVHRIVDLALSSLNKAAELVRQFKRTAVDADSSQILDFAAIDIIRKVLEDCSHRLETSSVDVILTGDGDDGIRSYPVGLEQIMTILVDNSLIHGFSEDVPSNRRISIEISHENDLMVLIYRDNGKGIAAESRTRLFDPFHTTGRIKEHTGLGLFIAHRLATEQMSGALSYLPESGSGAAFRLEIPSLGPSTRFRD